MEGKYQEHLKAYLEAELDIQAKKKEQKDLITAMNEIHKEKGHGPNTEAVTIKFDDKAYSVTTVIDRESKKAKENPLKIFGFKMVETKIIE